MPAAFTLQPAPLGNGDDSRSLMYMTSVPPVDPNVKAPPGCDPDLAEWIDLLRSMPIAKAAGVLDQRYSAPTEALPTVTSIGRHARPTDIAEPPMPAVPAAAASPADDGETDEDLQPDHAELVDPEADADLERIAAADDLATADEETVADEAYVYEPTDEDYSVDKKGRRVFHYVASEGAGYIAVDADNSIFTDADGKFIAVTNAGLAIDDRTGLSGAIGKVKNLWHSGGASTDELVDDLPDLYDEHGVPIEHFPVGKPGQKIGIGTNKVWGSKRLAFTGAVAATVSAGALLIGITWGRGAVPAEGAVSPGEAAAYRLSTMPISAMAAFGEQYLQTCLTHGDREQMKARAALLASMSTGGAADGCGWTDGGEVQQPFTIAYTGRAKAISGSFDTGRGAYLEYLVSTRPGKYKTYSVPVWVQADNESNDMIVVGDIGITPGMRVTGPSGYTPAGEPDPTLAADLQANLLKPFLSAWAASDRTQIDLAVTADASADAKRGLNGEFKSPQIDQVVAYTNRSSSGGQSVQYSNGDVASLQVTVTWKISGSRSDSPDSTQTTAYRIRVVRTGGKWLVSDIAGGAAGDRAAQRNSNTAAATDSDEEPGIAGITPGSPGGPVTDSPTSTAPSAENTATTPTPAPAESSAEDTP